MLRDSDLSPIRYRRVAEVDDKEVPWEHIVKGYEYEKGQFVVITEDDFKRVNVASNQTVDIKEFVKLEEIDPMFFDEPYFLAPEKGGAKAYVLLRDSLRASGKVGIAKVVIKTREHLAAVKPKENALVLELMHFADELVNPEELQLPNAAVGKKELAMAEMLIGQMSAKWQPEKFKDDYREALMKLIEEKIAAGGEKVPSEKRPARKTTNVVDLASVLQQSLAQQNKKARPAARKVRKAA